MPTTNVSGNYTGTGFAINVTPCNLDTNTAVIDFIPFIAGSVASPSLFTKTTATSLTYIGASLPASTSIVIQRKTPTSALKTAAFGGRIASADWNAEIDRRVRLSEEYTLNGIGPGSVVSVALPIDAAFGVSWSGDTSFPPTRNAVYNWGVTLAPIASPIFTGVPSAPTAALNTNTTQLSTTAFVQNQLATYAPLASPAFTGNPTCVTQTVGDNSTRLANTAFVTAATSGAQPKVSQGRLTLQTGKPIMDASTTSSTLYFTPYNGNVIFLYDGTSVWTPIAFTEISLALSGLTVGRPYDVFVWNNSGTATLELTAWTNSTTRATALVRQNGVLCRSGATTRRYVGTIYTTSATQTLVDARRCFVWNAENRVPFSLATLQTTANWTYASTTIRQSNADTTMQVEVIAGEASQPIDLQVGAYGSATLTGSYTGLGLDSTTSFISFATSCYIFATGTFFSTVARYTGLVPLGYHYYSKNEVCDSANTTTYYGNAGSSGITGTWFY